MSQLPSDSKFSRASARGEFSSVATKSKDTLQPRATEDGDIALAQTLPANHLDAPPSTAHSAEPSESREPDSPESRRALGQISAFLGRLRYWIPQHDESRTPAFLLSVIFHTALLLLLVLWSLPRHFGTRERTDALLLPADIDSTTNSVEILAVGDSLAPPSPVLSPQEVQPSQTARSGAVLSDLLVIEAPKEDSSTTPSTMERLLQASSLDVSASFAATGVDGRDQKKRRNVALANGGTLESEKAVEAALDWLAAHQRPNGSWSLLHQNDHCKKDCPNEGSKDRFDTAATGLALLAFLGAGYTHKEGKHRETVRRGVYFLLQVQEETPQGGSFLYQSERGMYNHGIASFALCEAYQLTLDRDLKKPAQQAVDFIVSAQTYRGGWGYLPKKPGDLTLSGWQIMALKSAFAAGLEVSPSTILRIDTFLDSQQQEGGTFYGYGKPGKSPTCSAIGLLLRLFRGMTHTDPRIIDGVAYFHRVGPSRSDVYYDYYVTLFLFHVGGPIWEAWNENMREFLVRSQATSGHAKGSWFFDNPYGKEGGRLYTTAMCAMTLEVYYRYSPLYRQTDIHFEL